MSLCKLPAHLHVKPTDQNTRNRMFSIKVSHINVDESKLDRKEGRDWEGESGGEAALLAAM